MLENLRNYLPAMPVACQKAFSGICEGGSRVIRFTQAVANGVFDRVAPQGRFTQMIRDVLPGAISLLMRGSCLGIGVYLAQKATNSDFFMSSAGMGGYLAGGVALAFFSDMRKRPPEGLIRDATRRLATRHQFARVVSRLKSPQNLIRGDGKGA